MKIKRISAIIAAVCLMLPLTLTGCKSKLSKEDYIFTKEVRGVTYTLDLSRFADDDFSNYDKYKAYADKFEDFLGLTNDVDTAYPDKEYGFQTELPAEGEKVAVLHTNKGDIKLRLFPEGAPKAVENFITHIEQGYYNGVTFHRVINDFMIQGGDPEGTGMGGESTWGGSFDGGTDPHLVHAAGAVAYANSGSTSTDGSQFYIVTGEVYTEDEIATLESYGYTFSDSAKEVYETAGGTPWLDGSYTIFGQVYSGLDTVFAVQNVETDSGDKPVEDVVVESITVEQYAGEDVKWYISDYE